MQRELTDRLLLAHRKAASCSSLFRRERLQRHTLTVVRELWVRKERTGSPSGSDWEFALMRLLNKPRAQTIRVDEPIAISEGWGKGEWGAKSTPHPLSWSFYKGVSCVFSEGWGVWSFSQPNFRLVTNKTWYVEISSNSIIFFSKSLELSEIITIFVPHIYILL